MTERFICPACSAPMQIEKGQDRAQCSFCDAVFEVLKEGESLRLRVYSQPKPQKNVLSEQGNKALREDIQEKNRVAKR